MSNISLYEASEERVRLFCASNETFVGLLQDIAQRIQELGLEEDKDNLFFINVYYVEEGYQGEVVVHGARD